MSNIATIPNQSTSMQALVPRNVPEHHPGRNQE